MAATEFTTEPLDTTPNPNRLDEPTHRPAAFLVWEAKDAYTRKDLTVDNSAGTTSILPGTVIVNGADAFVGILYGRPVVAGAIEEKTVVYRGPAIVRNEKLIFPSAMIPAIDGNGDPIMDANAEPVLVADAAATAALEAALRVAIAAVGIAIQ